MDLKQLQKAMVDQGCTRLYAKPLAANDDSKKQVYFGSGFEALNILPFKLVKPATRTGRPQFYGKLAFSWMDDQGHTHTAPGAQLILYPQYPEVRFSGFLRGCVKAPAKQLAYGASTKYPRRLLFLGVKPSGEVLGYLAFGSSPILAQFGQDGLTQFGVFYELPLLTPTAGRAELLAELLRIHQLDWLDATRLKRSGSSTQRVPCKGTNCGGYTLEAELGITPNGHSEPDYLGWEVKQHTVNNFTSLTAGPITLFTPEPQAGCYKLQGVESFVRRFGYADLRGREDRLNFGGIHKVGERHPRTRLTLTLVGYDAASKKIIDTEGGIVLVADDGEEAAKWPFSHLLEHWNRKHAKAAYVPSMHRAVDGLHQYRYGNRVRLNEQTDFLKYLAAMSEGRVYLDPGIKVEQASTATPKIKCRNQFRIKHADLSCLYVRTELVTL